MEPNTILEKAEVSYRLIMVEVANRLIREGNELRAKGYAGYAAKYREADIIKHLLVEGIPAHLQPLYRAEAMRIQREADPEWQDYQRLRLKFGNVDV